LPARIYSSVSVPASFEANQRKDLINALSNAGILVDESSLIDEPNAAFLSYLSDMERTSVQKEFIDKILEKERRVMVFDFGAGTCDISVLEVKVENERLLSKNLAISKFMALGGDDIDREIAKKVLLPQLFKGKNPADVTSTFELDNVVLPRLKPTAEVLKIQCCHMIETQGHSLESLRENSTPIQGNEIEAITIQNQRWELTTPQITLSEFAEVMDPFLNSEDQPHEQTQNQVRNVLEPVHDALDKSGLSKDDLNMLLFIGGSSANPLVRKAIEANFGRFVEFVTPRDLRAHVSKGSALHSLFLHGFNWEMIHPITSEAIYVITRNGVLEEVLPAGTEVPSPDINVTEFSIDRDGQQRIELPFCVGGADKVLGIVAVMCPDPQGSFKAGTPVRVSCSVTHEKLLNVIVFTGETKQTAKIFNPLANTELTPQHRQLLQAKQALNESILRGNGRPSVDVLLKYAQALENAKRWRKAAETMEIIVEQLDPSLNLATNIAYCYSKDGDSKNSDKWAEEAYKRSPESNSAYNLALTRKHQGNTESYEKLMEESISLDHSNYATLLAFGCHLMEMDKNDTRGREYIVSACEILNDLLEKEDLDEDDCNRLEKVAQKLGKQDILKSLRLYRKKLGVSESLINPDFLVSPKNPNMMKKDTPKAVTDYTTDVKESVSTEEDAPPETDKEEAEK
jgi:molecular chaperone DnaK (HSP70)